MQLKHLLSHLTFILVLTSSAQQTAAQIGIGTTAPDTSAMLEISATNKGFLAPRMNNVQMNAISTPATGLTVFNTDSNHYFVYADGGWLKMISGVDTVNVARSLSDADTDTKVEVAHTADEDKIRFTLGGKEYFRMNKGTLEFNNTSKSIYLGEGAGLSHDYNWSNPYPLGNIGIGANALQTNASGYGNVGIGADALNHLNNTANTAVGYQSGYTATTATLSTFMGYLAGYGLNGRENVMVGSYTGVSTSNGSDNVFVGSSAGERSIGSSNVFIGKAAGYQVRSGSSNICIGAGVTGVNGMSNTLLIDNTATATPLIYGNFDTDSVRIGGMLNINGNYTLPKADGTAGYLLQTNGAGTTSWAAPSTLRQAMAYLQDADSNTRIEVEKNSNEDKIRLSTGGTERLVINQRNIEVLNSGNSVIIGENAVASAAPASLVAIGSEALRYATGGGYNVAMGFYAMRNQSTGGDNVAVGANALQYATGNNNAGLGSFTLFYNHGDNNTALGYQALQNNTYGSGNVAIGQQAGRNETESNKLYIDNSSTASPLIYGDFAADSLRINGSLTVNGSYTLPKSDGSNGYVMKTNGTGQATWAPPSITTQIADADNDTRIEAERIVDEDKIRFRLDGTDQWLMSGSRLENLESATLAIGRNAALSETGLRYNLYYGINAGQDNQVGLYNTAIGNNALKANLASQNVAVGFQASSSSVNGSDNISIGTFAQYANTDGSNNVSIGSASLHNNTLGSGNVAIGNEAGYFETGSGKLYIANSNTTTPLIYGDFANDSLRINGRVNINGNYTLPKTAGSNGYVMQTDGAGTASWANPNALINETDPQVSSTTSNKIPKWNGSTLMDGIIYDSGTNIGIGTTPANTESTLVLGARNTTDEGGQLQLNGPGNNLDYFIDNNSGNLRFMIGTPSASLITMMTLSTAGNLGIGTTSDPTERMDVNGNIKASGTVKTNNFKMANGATAGYVLTSDAMGNATWSAPIDVETDPQVSSAATNRYPYWNGTTLVDGNIYRNSTNGFVGIGVSSAATPLETNGSVRFSAATNADIQLNSGTRPTIYPAGPNVPTNLEVQLRSAGSGSLFFNLDNTGNVSAVAGGGNMMVGAGIPAARLDVGGSFKLGTDGSVLTGIIKSNYGVSTASIAANTAVTYSITVNGAALGASVSASPNADMPNGVHISSVRVSSANTVSLKIYNTTSSSVSLSGITNYYISIIN